MERTFEQKVMSTAETYIRKNRWSDAVQLIRYVETIEEPSHSNLISILITKLLKDSLILPDLNKTLRVYQEIRAVIEDSVLIPATDKCSVYNNLACTYKNLGNVIQARKYAEKACSLSLTPKFPFAERAAVHLNLVSILVDMGKHEKAANEAMKVIEGFSKLTVLNDQMQKLLANACFYYANMKVCVKDLHEASKFYKKTILILEKIPDSQDMLREAQLALNSVQNEVYQKPRSRPVSANFKQKVQSRVDFSKIRRNEDSSRMSTRKSNHYIRPGSGSKLVNNEMLRYKKEIERIISRPPLYEKKGKSFQSQLKISSQSGIRILPTRSEYDKSFATPSSNSSIVNMHNESHNTVILSRIDNISQTDHYPSLDESTLSPIKTVQMTSFICPGASDLNAVLRIQAYFRGHLVRKSLPKDRPCSVFMHSYKEIKGKTYFVLVFHLLSKVILEIIDLSSSSLVFRHTLPNDSTQYLDQLLQSLELDSSHKFKLPDESKLNCFKHVQRTLKKIGDEDLILDCFSNDKQEVLIKGKSVKSQKEFSVKVKKGISSKKDIEEKIVNKLRIKQEVLVLSESMDLIPALMAEGEKEDKGSKFVVSVYLNFEKFLVVANALQGDSRYSMEVEPLRRTKSCAQDLWDMVQVRNGKIVIEEEKDEDSEKENKDCFGEGKMEKEVAGGSDKREKVGETGKISFVHDSDSGINEGIEKEDLGINVSSISKISDEEDLKDKSKNLNILEESKSHESLEQIKEPERVLESSNKISITSSHSKETIPKLLIPSTSPNSLTTQQYYLQSEGNLKFNEVMRLDYLTNFEIAKQSFKLHCMVFQSFLQIDAEIDSEKYSVFLKSIILEGYPEDCPLKRILTQNVFPRLYFKETSDKKILTYNQKFLIESLEDLNKSNLILEFIKEINDIEMKVSVFKHKTIYSVSNDKNSQVFWLPLKILKNFGDLEGMLEFVKEKVTMIEMKKFGLIDLNGHSLYSLFNYEISEKEFLVVIKKEEGFCFVEAHRPASEIYCSLFLQGQMYEELSVLHIAKSLKIMKVREDYSLISELV